MGANSIYQILIPSDKTINDSTTIPAWKSTGLGGAGKFLGVYGYIYYKDIYGDDHWTRFNLQYGRKNFIFASEKNDADMY